MKKKISDDLIEKLLNLAKMSHGLTGKNDPLWYFTISSFYSARTTF